jgi:hypothetical protein
MSPMDIVSALRERPFEPLRFIVSDGSAYDIYHPDLVFVGSSTSHIGFPSEEGSPFFERTIRVDNGHISRIIPVRLAKESPIANGIPA